MGGWFTRACHHAISVYMVALKHHQSSTIEDIMALPEDTKAELIDGEIFIQDAALAGHSYVGTLLASDLVVYFKGKKKKAPAGEDSDSWRIISEAWTQYDDFNVFIHDIAGFSRKDLPQLPTQGPITVKPLWVCEILSPSNWRNDTQRKRVILEKYRVPYYWLVDPDRKAIQVFEMLGNADKYQFAYAVEAVDGVVKLPPFTDLELDLREVFEL